MKNVKEILEKAQENFIEIYGVLLNEYTKEKNNSLKMDIGNSLYKTERMEEYAEDIIILAQRLSDRKTKKDRKPTKKITNQKLRNTKKKLSLK